MEDLWSLLLVFKNASKNVFYNKIHFNDCCKFNISSKNQPTAILDISELSHRLWLLGATKIAYKLAPVTSQFFLFYLQVIKKDKTMIQDSELYTHEKRISLLLRERLLLSKENLRIRDFFLGDRRNNKENLKQSIKYC